MCRTLYWITPVRHEAVDVELAPMSLAMPCLVPRHDGGSVARHEHGLRGSFSTQANRPILLQHRDRREKVCPEVPVKGDHHHPYLTSRHSGTCNPPAVSFNYICLNQGFVWSKDLYGSASILGKRGENTPLVELNYIFLKDKRTESPFNE
ncbi:hypothetical protein E6C27_scaffold60G003490 [Cucumis melo var. makuwa]|uniref:Uncharacterized protein n=1 Tax=Cucumis melo var. makuwa TaxID=1194695 RepID=A0A5A7UBV6_CUCMM|nr:hypothetical protein E6C27_scaffold60G003490 [Cucumis melo var. makuwa]